ncbi:MAG: CvpA family protein [Clostridia bacterium]|nr:CvpA family protein [Clostridia bacterium]
MSMIIDVILVVLVLLIVYKSYQNGFVKTFLDTFSVLISAIASFAFSGTVADTAYDMFIGDLVKTEFKRALDDLNKGVSLSDKLNAMIEALPKPAIGIAEYTGVNLEYLKSTVSGASSATDAQLIEIVADKIAYDLMIGVVQVISFFALFIIFTLVIKVLSSFISHVVEKLPIVGGLDSLLGIVFGLLKGAIILLAVGVLLTVIVATAESGSPLLAIEESKIYTALTSLIPILK